MTIARPSVQSFPTTKKQLIGDGRSKLYVTRGVVLLKNHTIAAKPDCMLDRLQVLQHSTKCCKAFSSDLDINIHMITVIYQWYFKSLGAPRSPPREPIVRR